MPAAFSQSCWAHGVSLSKLVIIRALAASEAGRATSHSVRTLDYHSSNVGFDVPVALGLPYVDSLLRVPFF